MPDIEDHVQVLIGALRVSADALKLRMAGHISSEVSKEGIRVIESQFPDATQVGDVTKIDDEMVQSWASQFSNVGVVLVGGGPPCQGVSGLNSDRKGALKDARSSLFVHVRRVYLLCKKYFRWAQVHYFMESVFSMDAKDRATMSEHMETLPVMADAADFGVCRRPRLYWLSWEILGSPEVTVSEPVSDGWIGYREVHFQVDTELKRFFSKGWELEEGQLLPTFTTSRPRPQRGNRPAGLWQCTPEEVTGGRQTNIGILLMSIGQNIS